MNQVRHKQEDILQPGFNWILPKGDVLRQWRIGLPKLDKLILKKKVDTVKIGKRDFVLGTDKTFENLEAEGSQELKKAGHHSPEQIKHLEECRLHHLIKYPKTESNGKQLPQYKQ